MIKIKQLNDRRQVPLSHLSVGETFLMDGCVVCMIARRNGHDYVLNLSTGKDLNVKVQGSTQMVYPVTCELTYKFE